MMMMMMIGQVRPSRPRQRLQSQEETRVSNCWLWHSNSQILQ